METRGNVPRHNLDTRCNELVWEISPILTWWSYIWWFLHIINSNLWNAEVQIVVRIWEPKISLKTAFFFHPNLQLLRRAVRLAHFARGYDVHIGGNLRNLCSDLAKMMLCVRHYHHPLENLGMMPQCCRNVASMRELPQQCSRITIGSMAFNSAAMHVATALKCKAAQYMYWCSQLAGWSGIVATGLLLDCRTFCIKKALQQCHVPSVPRLFLWSRDVRWPTEWLVSVCRVHWTLHFVSRRAR